MNNITRTTFGLTLVAAAVAVGFYAGSIFDVTLPSNEPTTKTEETKPVVVESVVLTLPSAYTSSDIHFDALRKFSSLVSEKTDGKLLIDIIANTNNTTEIKSEVGTGEVAIGEILLANYGSQHPIFAMDFIPFTASSYKDAKRLYEAQRELLESELEKDGLKLLYTAPWGAQGFVTNKTINNVSDLKGVKIRASNTYLNQFVDNVNASPIFFNGNSNEGLANNMFDVYTNSAATMLTTQAFKYAKNYYDVNAWIPKNAVVINKAVFESFDTDTQTAIVNAAKEAETNAWKFAEESSAESVNKLKQNGMNVVYFSDKTKVELAGVGYTLMQKWANTEELKGVLKKFTNFSK